MFTMEVKLYFEKLYPSVLNFLLKRFYLKLKHESISTKFNFYCNRRKGFFWNRYNPDLANFYLLFVYMTQ